MNDNPSQEFPIVRNLDQTSESDSRGFMRSLTLLALCGGLSCAGAPWLDGRYVFSWTWLATEDPILYSEPFFLTAWLLFFLFPIVVNFLQFAFPTFSLANFVCLVAMLFMYYLLAPVPLALLALSTLTVVLAVLYQMPEAYMRFVLRHTVLPPAIQDDLLTWRRSSYDVKSGAIVVALLEQWTLCCTTPTGFSRVPYRLAVLAATLLGFLLSHIPPFSGYGPELRAPLNYWPTTIWLYLKPNFVNLVINLVLAAMYYLLPFVVLAVLTLLTVPLARRAYAVRHHVELATIWEKLIDDIQNSHH